MTENNDAGETDPNLDPDDPLYLSPEERERIFKLTDQFSRPQALEKVLHGERYRRFVAAEARLSMQRSSEESQRLREAEEEALEQRRREELQDLLRETTTPEHSSEEPSE